MSQGMLDYAEPDTPPHYLPPDVDDATLGKTLRIALAASKTVSMPEFQKIFHSGVVQKLSEERNAWAMQYYGYKTKRAMLRKMNCCSVKTYASVIEIKPWHHKTLDGYSGISNDGPEILHLPITVTDAELGGAIREGFKRCTSSVK